MTERDYTALNAGTAGTALTVSNFLDATGANPASQVFTTSATAATATFDTVGARYGSGYRFIAPSGAQSFARIPFTAAGNTQHCGAEITWNGSFPTGTEYTFFAIRQSSGSGFIFRLLVSSAGKIIARGSSGTIHITDSTDSPVAGTTYWVTWGLIGGSTTTSTIRFGVGSPTSGAAPTTIWENTASNASANVPYSVDIGATGADAIARDMTFKNLRIEDGVATLFAPMASNVAPTANAGSAQYNIEPYSTVTLTGSGTDTDGTISGYTWTQTGGTSVTLTGATSATPTFVAPATITGDTLTFSLVVTDNVGATSPAVTTTVGVLPHTIFRIGASSVLSPYRASRI